MVELNGADCIRCTTFYLRAISSKIRFLHVKSHLNIILSKTNMIVFTFKQIRFTQNKIDNYGSTQSKVPQLFVLKENPHFWWKMWSFFISSLGNKILHPQCSVVKSIPTETEWATEIKNKNTETSSTCSFCFRKPTGCAPHDLFEKITMKHFHTNSYIERELSSRLFFQTNEQMIKKGWSIWVSFIALTPITPNNGGLDNME